LLYSLFFFFFFSSRRRHTRWTGDWSSDVCSSDLRRQYDRQSGGEGWSKVTHVGSAALSQVGAKRRSQHLTHPVGQIGHLVRHPRSEERRVGKECRSRGTPYQ